MPSTDDIGADGHPRGEVKPGRGVIRPVLLAGVLLLVGYCFAKPVSRIVLQTLGCDITVLRRVANPAGSRYVVFGERNCGVTVKNDGLVAIQKNPQLTPLAQEAALFLEDTVRFYIQLPGPDIEPELEWRSDSVLEVIHDPRVVPRKARGDTYGVTIRTRAETKSMQSIAAEEKPRMVRAHEDSAATLHQSTCLALAEGTQSRASDIDWDSFVPGSYRLTVIATQAAIRSTPVRWSLGAANP